MDLWPDCTHTECAYKICTWGSDLFCYVHEEQIVGKVEMDRRYDLTHERPTREIGIGPTPNYMTRTFKELNEYI